MNYCDIRSSSYDVDYEVKYMGEKYFSILFWGMRYDSGAYHNDIALGLTYDMTTGQLLGIADIIEESELQQRLEQRDFEQVYGMKIKYYESDVNGGEVNWFNKYLAGESIDEYGKHNTDFYLTADRISVLYEIPHSFGDYIVVEIEWKNEEKEI